MNRLEERFFKYQGLGNDFVVLDRRQTGRDIDDPTARALCDRRLGIGADGVLCLLPAPSSDGAVAQMVVHNADGSIPEMCGNGLRCAVKYLAENAAHQPSEIKVLTGAGVLNSALHYENGRVKEVEVDMGPARLLAPNLPSRAGKPFVRAELSGEAGIRGTAVSMGNPHLVLFDVPLDRAGILGARLELHSEFPDRTNVEFTVRKGDGLKVVVWERGVGLTQACGTGACAAVAAYVLQGELPAGRFVPVELPGGVLNIRVEADLSAVRLRGPADFVFEGIVQIASDK